MFCPEGKCICEDGVVFYGEMRRPNTCRDWVNNECLKHKHLAASIKHSDKVMESIKTLVSNSEEMSAQARLFTDIILDDIQNSAAPENVKEYIKKYLTSQHINDLLDEAGINNEERNNES